MNLKFKEPPRFAHRFFRWFCHPKLRDSIEGDLMELYEERVKELGRRKADIKFVIDVILLFRPGIIRPAEEHKNLNTCGMYKHYLKVTTRSVLKQKAYNILNVLGLSVGISSGLIIALHIRDELSYEKSFHNYENIYRVHRENWAASSPPLAGEFKEFFPDIDVIGRFAPYGTRVVTTDKNNPGEVTGFYADSTVLKIFGFQVLDGDPDPLTAVNTAVITQRMATRYFGNENPIGKILKFDNQKEFPVTAVIEDLPVNTHLKFDFLISMPTFYSERENPDQNRGWMMMYTYACFKPGTLANISGRMSSFIRKYYTGDPDIEQKIATRAWQLMPLKDIHLHSNMEKEMSPNSSIVYIYVFVAVEILILLVASANFMSLFTTQAIRRVKEVGMRKIMGAKSGQLMAQFLTEVLLLTVFSTLLAIGLYQLALPFYNNLSGKTLEPWQIFEMDSIITIGVILLIVIVISGLYPAFFITRFNAGSFLKESKLPRSMPNLVRSGLVVFQFFVSVALIAAAILVQQQMSLIRNKDLGFDKEQVISVKLYGYLWWRAFSEPDALKSEFLSNPEILAVGRADRIIGERLSVEMVVPKGKDSDNDELPGVRVLRVDEGYLDVMSIPLADGRNFSTKFNDSTSFIINESAAKALELTSPVSTELTNPGVNRKGKIVGVVKDYHFASLHSEIEPLVIEFQPGWSDNLLFKIRSKDPRATIDYIKSTIDKLAPNSLFVYQFLDDRVDALYKSEDTMGKVFQFFSVLAIVIACLGLFGMSAYTIESRTKEIGIRKVLGATVVGIVKLVSSGVFRLILIGFTIAVPVTWYVMNKWLNNFAYKIEIEWWVFASTGMAVILIAALAISFHTLKGASTNPVNSLRNE